MITTNVHGVTKIETSLYRHETSNPFSVVRLTATLEDGETHTTDLYVHYRFEFDTTVDGSRKLRDANQLAAILRRKLDRVEAILADIVADTDMDDKRPEMELARQYFRDRAEKGDE
jgi:hypothetical protein